MSSVAARVGLLEERLGYVFADKALAGLALLHASAAPNRLASNERMEFLGDAVLGLMTCQAIYEMYPGLLEGEMTKIKSMVVSRLQCAKMAQKLGLTELVEVAKGMEAVGGENGRVGNGSGQGDNGRGGGNGEVAGGGGGGGGLPMSVAAAVMEAVIAAVYLDASGRGESGIERVRGFLLPVLGPIVKRAAMSGHMDNFKSVLQQHAQKVMGESPEYLVLDEQGPDHAKSFEIAVQMGGQRYESCWGGSKKEAEQAAALVVLRELGVVEEDEDGEVVVVGGEGC